MATKKAVSKKKAPKPVNSTTGNRPWVDDLELQIHPDHRSPDNGGRDSGRYKGSHAQYNGDELAY